MTPKPASAGYAMPTGHLTKGFVDKGVTLVDADSLELLLRSN